MSQILVIDSDELSRNFMRSALNLAGHITRCVSNAKSVLEAIRVSAPDVILCDLTTPQHVGFDTIHALHVLMPDIPIIALAGRGKWDLGEIFKAAAELGAQSVLLKPVVPENLLGTIDRVLEGYPELLLRNDANSAAGAALDQ